MSGVETGIHVCLKEEEWNECWIFGEMALTTVHVLKMYNFFCSAVISQIMFKSSKGNTDSK